MILELPKPILARYFPGRAVVSEFDKLYPVLSRHQVVILNGTASEVHQELLTFQAVAETWALFQRPLTLVTLRPTPDPALCFVKHHEADPLTKLRADILQSQLLRDELWVLAAYAAPRPHRFEQDHLLDLAAKHPSVKPVHVNGGEDIPRELQGAAWILGAGDKMVCFANTCINYGAVEKEVEGRIYLGTGPGLAQSMVLDKLRYILQHCETKRRQELRERFEMHGLTRHQLHGVAR